MGVPPAVESLISHARVSAHLATSVDDRPHVAPVWYVYEAGSLYALTGGRKLRNLRRNPRVAVSIERADETGVAWSTHLLGTARVVEDPDLERHVEERLDEIYDFDDAEADGGEDESALIEIRVGSATAQEY